MAERKITSRQKKFIAEYVRCLNASEAARLAGYAESGAAVRGHELVRNRKIAALIQDEFDKQSMSAEEVIARLAAQARSDIGDFFGDDGTVYIDMRRAKELGISHLIKKFKQTTVMSTDKDGDGKETHIFEFELHDPQKALVHLGKTMAMFIDKKDVNHSGHVKHTILSDMTDDELDELLDE